ncbi:MAG TPA: MFS transporter, partial [Ornithinibacter sp.]|nr:MFS transporter [Ornithinibacter sp.]
SALLDPAMLRIPMLQRGLTAFFFQFLLQAGLFFCIPLYLSVALGLSAVDTGIRIMPLSLTLLLAAVGIPKLFPDASPRRVVQLGFLALLAGIVSLMGALEVGVGPEVVTGPLLLAGLGIGALASQLGAVTVSAVPDEQSGEVGGIQNTFTNLGASIGTALAGAVLISALTTSFFTGIDDNEAIPPSVTAQAQVELASGIPFVSDAQLETALADAGVDDATAAAIMDENTQSRLAGLRSALAVLALVALIAFFASGRLPTRQPGATVPDGVSPPAAR